MSTIVLTNPVSLHCILVLEEHRESWGPRFLHGSDLLDDCRADRHHKFSSRKYRRVDVPKHTFPAPATRRLSGQRLRTRKCCIATHVSRGLMAGNLALMLPILGMHRLLDKRGALSPKKRNTDDCERNIAQGVVLALCLRTLKLSAERRCLALRTGTNNCK